MRFSVVSEWGVLRTKSQVACAVMRAVERKRLNREDVHEAVAVFSAKQGEWDDVAVAGVAALRKVESKWDTKELVTLSRTLITHTTSATDTARFTENLYLPLLEEHQKSIDAADPSLQQLHINHTLLGVAEVPVAVPHDVVALVGNAVEEVSGGVATQAARLIEDVSPVGLEYGESLALCKVLLKLRHTKDDPAAVPAVLQLIVSQHLERVTYADAVLLISLLQRLERGARRQYLNPLAEQVLRCHEGPLSLSVLDVALFFRAFRECAMVHKDLFAALSTTLLQCTHSIAMTKLSLRQLCDIATTGSRFEHPDRPDLLQWVIGAAMQVRLKQWDGLAMVHMCCSLTGCIPGDDLDKETHISDTKDAPGCATVPPPPILNDASVFVARCLGHLLQREGWWNTLPVQQLAKLASYVERFPREFRQPLSDGILLGLESRSWPHIKFIIWALTGLVKVKPDVFTAHTAILPKLVSRMLATPPPPHMKAVRNRVAVMLVHKYKLPSKLLSGIRKP